MNATSHPECWCNGHRDCPDGERIEHEFDVLNCVTEACDGDRSHYDVDPHYWRKWLKITVQPSGRQFVW